MALFQDPRPTLWKGAMRDLWCHGFATYIDVCVQLAEMCVETGKERVHSSPCRRKSSVRPISGDLTSFLTL